MEYYSESLTSMISQKTLSTAPCQIPMLSRENMIYSLLYYLFDRIVRLPWFNVR